MSGFLGMFTYGGAATPSEYIAYSTAIIGRRVSAYPWSDASGFGSVYSATTSINLLTNEAARLSFTKDNSLFSFSNTIIPFVHVWPWSSSGFGTKYASPSSPLLPTGAGTSGHTWTPATDAYLTINIATPNSTPQAWAWSGGFGSKYSNGATVAGLGAGISMNADGTQVVVSHAGSPYISMYPWSSGFGTKYSNPATLPTGAPSAGAVTPSGVNVGFNPVTNDVAIGHTVSPYITTYPVTSGGFGTKYANPSSLPVGTTDSLKFASTGTLLGAGSATSPYITVWAWSSGFGSKYSDPASLPTTATTSMDWSSTADSIVTAGNTTSPYTAAYPWSGGFGTKYSNPGTLPTTALAVSFSNQSR
jgi:hypothetical protein